MIWTVGWQVARLHGARQDQSGTTTGASILRFPRPQRVCNACSMRKECAAKLREASRVKRTAAARPTADAGTARDREVRCPLGAGQRQFARNGRKPGDSAEQGFVEP